MFKFLYNNTEVQSSKVYMYQYDDNNFRICSMRSVREKGFEPCEKTNKKNITSSEEVTRVSVSRSRRNIRELALCNDFEYFCTFTINSNSCDRYSVDDCQKNLRKILKAFKRKSPDFIYLIITEKHLDGAFHFHGLCSKPFDLYINKNGYYSSSSFDSLGFNSFSKIESKEKVSNYILKYVTKDCVRNSAGTTYISSRGLKKASVTELSVEPKIRYTYSNDFCKIRDFNIKTISQKELQNIYFSE